MRDSELFDILRDEDKKRVLDFMSRDKSVLLVLPEKLVVKVLPMLPRDLILWLLEKRMGSIVSVGRGDRILGKLMSEDVAKIVKKLMESNMIRKIDREVLVKLFKRISPETVRNTFSDDEVFKMLKLLPEEVIASKAFMDIVSANSNRIPNYWQKT